MSVHYSYNKEKQFIIEDYDKARTFASFLPGIAGVDGIPMWAYYVNRGQVLGCFGVRDKNSTIMEFFPAQTMYKNIEYQGFRTFIKCNGNIHEIFSSLSTDENNRKMMIEKNSIKIVEENITLGIKATVTYFTIPSDRFAAVVRKVELENLDAVQKELEVLDGLPQILPYGVTNGDFQSMSNLMRAWFDVFNAENGIAFYKLRATSEDTVEVSEYREGNFYLSFSSESAGFITPIFDMNVIFGENTALSKPDGWNCPVELLQQRRQIAENKVSGGFSAVRTVLRDSTYTLCTVIGHVSSLDFINSIKSRFTLEYIEQKEKQAAELVDTLVRDTFTRTSDSMFDSYIEQCYLDNLLRGGYPLVFNSGDKNHIYHVFSRKHGDLEREYNFFSLEPAFYSQGNGNFRDVCQNRRNDVLINPEVRDFNVRHFMNLIQADGYNPLSVKGCTFTFDSSAWKELEKYLESHRDETSKLLEKKFTPGQLVTFLVEKGVQMNISKEEFLNKVLACSTQNFEAEFGEGYWSDHWTYNMDLIDSYLAVYPDQKEHLLFGESSYRFFYSPVFVLPRSDKYVLTNGKVRQYGAIFENKEKPLDCWLRTENGKGTIYETNLYVKLLSLALIKFVSLDPCGMGIEIEAGKPGWNDALNGLSGLFGSSMCETAELLRIVDFVEESSAQYEEIVLLPVEVEELLRKTSGLLEKNLKGDLSDFDYWDLSAGEKESYRSKIRYGICGEMKRVETKDVLNIFKMFRQKINAGMTRSLEYGNGIYPSYFTYEAIEYQLVEGKTNPVNGYQNVKIAAFECKPLPLFLEGPARVLKTLENKSDALKMYIKLRASDIFDRKLKMYKTSAPLEGTSTEIGRLKAFTAGWLERESIFMHMEYKYLYAMLQAGLYEQFYSDIKTMLVPFMEPEVYGRSTLENSSFIASSANPDESMHGRGFVSRMSGSTAEMLSMWFLMMAGKNIFTIENDQLVLELKPVLPDWLFDEKGVVSFKLLGSAIVRYINPMKLNTYGLNAVNPCRYVLTDKAGNQVEILGCKIIGEYAGKIRNGEIAAMDVYLN